MIFQVLISCIPIYLPTYLLGHNAVVSAHTYKVFG